MLRRGLFGECGDDAPDVVGVERSAGGGVERGDEAFEVVGVGESVAFAEAAGDVVGECAEGSAFVVGDSGRFGGCFAALFAGHFTELGEVAAFSDGEEAVEGFARSVGRAEALEELVEFGCVGEVVEGSVEGDVCGDELFVARWDGVVGGVACEELGGCVGVVARHGVRVRRERAEGVR